jgi:photosystem II stability/assembly factor-like uncharacterized protein
MRWTAALTAAALFAAPLHAAPGRWSRTGPEGGDACALAAAPSRPGLLYAGFTVGGVFRSADRGQTWVFAGRGLGKGNTACSLAVDPSAPATVWVGTALGLFKSTDGGASWLRKGAPITDAAHPAVFVVLAHPRQPGTLWAAVPGKGLFQTRNGGTSWQRLGSGLQGDVTALAVDPSRPSTLYAGTAQGAFKSTDSGAHWSLRPQTLSHDPAVQTLTVDPHNSSTVFLAPASGQLLKSTNGGASWFYSTIGLGSLAVRSVAVDPASSTVVYAATAFGVYKSTDAGHTWTGPRLAKVTSSVLANSTGLFAAYAGGVSASRDRAVTWQAGRGLFATVVGGLTVSIENQPRLYATEGDRVWKSADRGGFWLPLSPAPGIPVETAAAVELNAPGYVWAGPRGGVAFSADGGRHWSVTAVSACTTWTKIVLDPAAPDTVYIGGPITNLACARFPSVCGTFKSTDRGTTWSCIQNGLPDRVGSAVLALDPFAPSHLYTSSINVVSELAGLYRSLDGGASWTLLAPGITTTELAFDRLTPGLVYAGLERGVGRSTDAGATWTVHTGGLPTERVLNLALDPGDPSILYAATRSDVFRSADAGATWQRAAPGLEEVQVLDLAVDPDDPKILYVGTAGGSVMKLEQE